MIRSLQSWLNFLPLSSRERTAQMIIREILLHEGCPLDEGFLVNPGFDTSQILPFADQSIEQKSFPGIGGKQPSEIVAATSKSAIRKMVVENFMRRKHLKGEFYAHIWYYPGTYQTLAAFRVDCDDSDHNTFFNLAGHAHEFGIPLTWFLHVGAQESFLSEIRSLIGVGHEIQLHCYEHETYQSFQRNLKNIRKGKEIMVKAGFSPTGFVAPFGKWNPSLNRALEKLNFSFSSEFAVNYDDFPFFPISGNSPSRILQLPIHPICIGNLRRSGHSPEEMINYFDQYINRNYHERLPIMIYGHPYREIDYYGEVAREVFRMLTQLENVWITTYTGWFSWWMKRLSTKYQLKTSQDGILIETGNTDPQLRLRLIHPEGTEYFFPLMSGFYPLNITQNGRSNHR